MNSSNQKLEQLQENDEQQNKSNHLTVQTGKLGVRDKFTCHSTMQAFPLLVTCLFLPCLLSPTELSTCLSICMTGDTAILYSILLLLKMT